MFMAMAEDKASTKVAAKPIYPILPTLPLHHPCPHIEGDLAISEIGHSELALSLEEALMVPLPILVSVWDSVRPVGVTRM
jgi:hypothetical protein